MARRKPKRQPEPTQPEEQGAGPFGKFGPHRKEAYLEALRNGVGRLDAARSVGVSNELVRLYRKEYPEFVAEEDAAQDEANERVENALFRTALAGNVTACQVWLYNRTPDRWKDQRNLKVSGLEDVLNRLPPDFGRDVRRALATPLPGGNGTAATGNGGVPGAGSPAS